MHERPPLLECARRLPRAACVAHPLFLFRHARLVLEAGAPRTLLRKQSWCRVVARTWRWQCNNAVDWSAASAPPSATSTRQFLATERTASELSLPARKRCRRFPWREDCTWSQAILYVTAVGRRRSWCVRLHDDLDVLIETRVSVCSFSSCVLSMPPCSGSLHSWVCTYPECSPRDERPEPERVVPLRAWLFTCARLTRA